MQFKAFRSKAKPRKTIQSNQFAVLAVYVCIAVLCIANRCNSKLLEVKQRKTIQSNKLAVLAVYVCILVLCFANRCNSKLFEAKQYKTKQYKAINNNAKQFILSRPVQIITK